MRINFFILFIICSIIVVSLGCIESKKNPAPIETQIATSEPPISTPEHGLFIPNETEFLKINDTFETWSRGYHANYTDWNPYFRVFTNYSKWIEFLNEQEYGYPRYMDGELFPGFDANPKKIESEDFNNYFIIASMMGYQGKESPEIEIKNISRINNTVTVTARMYDPGAGASVMSSPYHIVIVKREVLPKGNFTFVFTDESNKLGSVEVKPTINLTYIPANVRGNTNFTVRWEVSGETSGEINYSTVNSSYLNKPMKFSIDRVWDINYSVVHWGYRSGSANMSDYPRVSKIQTGKTPQEFIADINAPAGGTLYVRAHAIADGVPIYSPEYRISIIY